MDSVKVVAGSLGSVSITNGSASVIMQGAGYNIVSGSRANSIIQVGNNNIIDIN